MDPQYEIGDVAQKYETPIKYRTSGNPSCHIIFQVRSGQVKSAFLFSIFKIRA
jgi:hypothetical protein